MARDPAAYCLTYDQMLLSYHGFEKLIIGYVVPCFILFGFTGNIINLTVLLAPGMKTRSNMLLACLALADMIFLVFMLPHAMAHYPVFSFNYYFRKFYLGNKMHLIAVLNWSSAAAIWLVLTICVERLTGIRYPLSVRKSRSFHTYLLVSGVICITGLLTFYNHFSYDCMMKIFCNGTQPHAICMPVDSPVWINNRTNPHSQILRAYVRWSPRINAVVVVFVPIVLVVLSNGCLIMTLRQRQKFLQVGTTPSAVVTITSGSVALGHPDWQIYLVTTTTFMVVVGKSLNFVLFCLSSANFRQRLVTMTKERLMKRRTVRRFSCESSGVTSMTTAFSTVVDRKASKVNVLKNKQPKQRSQSLNDGVQSQKGRMPLREMRGMSVVNEALLPGTDV
uniref:G_PROTEIN_RECEP_F1_2 domain-containing protein n=1 Tax=Steinernema glaseri TaxID=37863 RepID=A0A1I7YVY5_9BILA